MGDISAEPSMEEILSSIKRIIAEEGEGTPARGRRPQRAPVPIAREPESDEVLELREPMAAAERAEEPERAPQPRAVAASPVAAQRAPEPPAAQRLPDPPAMTRAAEPPAAPRGAEPIVSQQAAAASRGSLDALTRLVVRPEAPAAAAPSPADVTLEALVREMLRPMLREWLDAQLPAIVEAMVAREIERITGSR